MAITTATDVITRVIIIVIVVVVAGVDTIIDTIVVISIAIYCGVAGGALRREEALPSEHGANVADPGSGGRATDLKDRV